MSKIKIYSPEFAELVTLNVASSAELSERINADKTLSFSFPAKNAVAAFINDVNVVELDGDYYDIAEYKKEQPGDGYRMVTVECEHVSYRLNDPDYNLEFFTQTGTPDVILAEMLNGTGFSAGVIDFAESVTYSAQEAKSRRALVMEFVAYLGGEVAFNGFTVSILAQRGNPVPKALKTGHDVTVISKSVNKRVRDALGNPVIAYACGVYKPDNLELGDVVTLDYESLNIDVTLRIVRISIDPYNPKNMTIEVGNYANALENDLYRIETSSIAKGKTYFGARISPENGFESIRSDKLARTVMNANKFAMQAGDGSGNNWTDKLYFDPDTGKYIFDGELSANLITALEAEFDVTISNTVIVNQLSAQKGNIAELTVDQIDTSDFVQKYLASDTTPVGYWKGYDQNIEFYEAIYTSGSVQVTDRNNAPVYWLDETHEGTTLDVTDYPVMRYVYNGPEGTGNVKLRIYHEIDPETGISIPKIQLGVGMGVGTNAQGFIYKGITGLYFDYMHSTTGELRRIMLTDDGIDFSETVAGKVIYSDQTVVEGVVQVWVDNSMPALAKDDDLLVNKSNHRRYEYQALVDDSTTNVTQAEVVDNVGNTPALLVVSASLATPGCVKKICNSTPHVLTLSGTFALGVPPVLYPTESIELMWTGGDWKLYG